MTSMKQDARIFVAGHRGLSGSAIVSTLKKQGFENLLLRSHRELDLTDQRTTEHFFQKERPEYVFLAAAKVGGILANSTFPADFVRENLAIQLNVIYSAWKAGVKRLLFLGSSCIYPRDCPQPIREEYLLTGPLEFTNRPYAVAKIAGIEMCWAYNRQYKTRFIAVMPTNLFGPGDNYDLKKGHVIPSLIRKFHLAKLAALGDIAGIMADERCYGPIPAEVKKMIGIDPERLISPGTLISKEPEVVIWGTGRPKREFLYSGDLSEACVFLMNLADEDLFKNLHIKPDQENQRNPSPPLLNIGSSKEIEIKELAKLIRRIMDFEGKIHFDHSKPDGTPEKLLDSSKITGLGWRPSISLSDGLRLAYDDYLSRLDRI